jgi:hypothetical protein
MWLELQTLYVYGKDKWLCNIFVNCFAAREWPYRVETCRNSKIKCDFNDSLEN